jgi:hypothetical protein
VSGRGYRRVRTLRFTETLVGGIDWHDTPIPAGASLQSATAVETRKAGGRVCEKCSSPRSWTHPPRPGRRQLMRPDAPFGARRLSEAHRTHAPLLCVPYGTSAARPTVTLLAVQVACRTRSAMAACAIRTRVTGYRP